MATQLDRSFVKATLDNVRALANEVERLECYCAELEARLGPEEVRDASKAGADRWAAMDRIELK